MPRFSSATPVLVQHNYSDIPISTHAMEADRPNRNRRQKRRTTRTINTHSADVVVVGGGISGVCCAYYLSQHDLKVLLVERDGIASHASGFAFGGLSPLSGAGIPGPMLPLAIYSFSLHKQLRTQLVGEAKFDPNYRSVDSLDLASSQDDEERQKNMTHWINQIEGFSAELMSMDDMLAVEPRINSSYLSGMYIRGTMQVDSAKLVNVLHRRSGVETFIDEAVELDCAGNKIRGINLKREGYIPTNYVVLATGPWLGNTRLDYSIKMRTSPLKGQILRIRYRGKPISVSIGLQGNYISTKDDGLLWAGTTEEQVGFDETTNSQGRKSILKNIYSVLPTLKIESVSHQTACIRPMSQDGYVVLGEVPDLIGLYLCGGSGRKGILYGPAMGKLTADQIAAEPCRIDMVSFLTRRFYM